jgi:hypothetical protein
MARNRGTTAEFALADLFLRNQGYIRFQNPKRLKEGAAYKKGDEVRFMAHSAAELAEIQQLLRQASFGAGKPFVKHRGWCQPVYGRENTARFLEILRRSLRGLPLSGLA